MAGVRGTARGWCRGLALRMCWPQQGGGGSSGSQLGEWPVEPGAMKSKKQQGLCASRGCTGPVRPQGKTNHCADCIEAFAKGRTCPDCKRRHRGRSARCNTCLNYGRPSEQRVTFRRTDDGASSQHLRAILDADPQRQARIALYQWRASQGLPLFSAGDRLPYVRSRRSGGPVRMTTSL